MPSVHWMLVKARLFAVQVWKCIESKWCREQYLSVAHKVRKTGSSMWNHFRHQRVASKPKVYTHWTWRQVVKIMGQKKYHGINLMKVDSLQVCVWSQELDAAVLSCAIDEHPASFCVAGTKGSKITVFSLPDRNIKKIVDNAGPVTLLEANRSRIVASNEVSVNVFLMDNSIEPLQSISKRGDCLTGLSFDQSRIVYCTSEKYVWAMDFNYSEASCTSCGTETVIYEPSNFIPWRPFGMIMYCSNYFRKISKASERDVFGVSTATEHSTRKIILFHWISKWSTINLWWTWASEMMQRNKGTRWTCSALFSFLSPFPFVHQWMLVFMIAEGTEIGPFLPVCTETVFYFSRILFLISWRFCGYLFYYYLLLSTVFLRHHNSLLPLVPMQLSVAFLPGDAPVKVGNEFTVPTCWS